MVGFVLGRAKGLENWRNSLTWTWVSWDMAVGVATILALVLAGWQLRQNAKIAGQTHARGAWLRYLELGLQYPQYGSTEIAKRTLNVKSIEEIYLQESPESEAYLWFVDIMMESCESLVNYFPHKEWQDTIRYNISLHKGTIKHSWKSEGKFYSNNLQVLIGEVLQSAD